MYETERLFLTAPAAFGRPHAATRCQAWDELSLSFGGATVG
jgi:hypothetical protein